MVLLLATFGAVLLAPLSAWFAAVNRTVQESYLDEFFHVRQAQQYCHGRFDVWDPKITTPPGLYLLSYIISPVLQCDITALRLINAICLLALLAVIYATYVVRRKSNAETRFFSGLQAHHSSLNIALFPPLFFFSALYYTDVPSTLSVLIFYCYFIHVRQQGRTRFGQACVEVLLGCISLMFRQTNIFWVAVAPMGLVLIFELDQGHRVMKESMYRHVEGFGDSIYSVVKMTWKMDVIFDPPVREAYFEDYTRTVASIITRSLKVLTQPTRVFHLLLSLAPFFTLIAIFAAFILWNGGVVLGDRSAHVATLHAAQMLYLWPYIVFFSWPLLLPHLLLIPLMLISRVSTIAHLEPLLLFRRRYFLPRISVALGFTLLACVVVHFNTIVHPYLLADNRHYPFYVFKRLLRPWWLRYAVTPIYVLCAWACMEFRGEFASTAAAVAATRAAANKNTAAVQTSPPESESPTANGNRGNHADKEEQHRPFRLPDGYSTASVSFMLIFLVTTALQLCTAPLVEPRYFILPWIIWRMHLPLHAADGRRHRHSTTSAPPGWAATLQLYDHRLMIETAWFLLVNAVTGYMFLHSGFTWPSEPTAVQRFMW